VISREGLNTQIKVMAVLGLGGQNQAGECAQSPAGRRKIRASGVEWQLKRLTL